MLLIFILISSNVVVQVLAEAPPPPPQDVHVDNWLLTWTPTTEDRNVTYTVQYNTDLSSDQWTNVQSCVQTSFTSCDVSFTKSAAEHGCVKLRVRAKSGRLTSAPVNACSRHSDSCSPEVSLTVRPGSITVHLSRNHSLAQDYADHAKHRVYFGKEGELLQEQEDTASSVSFNELEEGQRYCVRVQYVYYSRLVGLSSCTQCELIPPSKTNRVKIIVTVVVVFVLVFLVPLISYILIFQQRRIKQWLRPPYQIPDDFFIEHHIPVNTRSPSEESYDVISSIIPADGSKE